MFCARVGASLPDICFDASRPGGASRDGAAAEWGASLCVNPCPLAATAHMTKPVATAPPMATGGPQCTKRCANPACTTAQNNKVRCLSSSWVWGMHGTAGGCIGSR